MSYVNNDGIRIHYTVDGSGPPLLLHHGMSESILRWRLSGMVDALRTQFRLILIDARGHGWSDKPHDPAAYTLEARALDVVAVLDELGIERTHYFGHSLGGWIGLGLARYAPHRLHSLTIGGAQPYGQSLEKFRQLLGKGQKAWFALIEQMSGPFLSAEREQMRRNDLRALRASIAHDRPDISAMLPLVTTPCLFFAGAADPLHGQVQRCAAEISGASFVSLPELNHFQVARRPNVMLPHLNAFLETLTFETAIP